MTAVMSESLDMRRLLAPIGVERFFAEHWQTRMALLPLAADDLAFIREDHRPARSGAAGGRGAGRGPGLAGQ